MRNINLCLYHFVGLLAYAIILTTCTAGTSILTATSVATATSPVVDDEQFQHQTPTVTLQPTLPTTATSLPASTLAPTSMPSPTLTATASPASSPTVTTIACVNSAPELEKRFPGAADLKMPNSRTFFDGDFVYLATQNYVGIIDTSTPARPKLYGFWQLPRSEPATDVLAYNGILYVASGSTVQVLNLNPTCRLSPIAQLELPFNVTQVEVEDGRLYVGGINDQINMEQLAIFAIQSPGRLEQLGLVNFGEEPVRWSVQQNEVFLLSGTTLSAIDISDPAAPVYRQVDITLDSERLVRQPREMVDNEFYYFSSSEGVNVIRELGQIAPHIQVTPKEYAMESVTRAMTESMQIGRDYIFLGINSCDVQCTSTFTIVSRESLEPLARVGLHPHYPSHAYVEITNEVIYAFSDDQLLVIDISDLEHPNIVRTVPLTLQVY